MGRKADVMLLVLAALEMGRRAGLIDSPPILSEQVALDVREMQRHARRPTRREVHDAVDRLAISRLLEQDQREGFVCVALAHLSKPTKRCALLDHLYGESRRFRDWLDRSGGYRNAKMSHVQLHHVWGGKTRVNLPSNLLPLCEIVHDWVHTVEPVAGRLACIWKRSTLPEFSWEELDHCAGLNVRGWVEAQTAIEHEPFTSMRQDIIACQLS